MKRDWMVAPSVNVGDDLVRLANGNLVVAQLLAQRGFETAAQALPFIDPDYYEPAPPEAMLGLPHAVETLLEELNRDHNILVWGDFDVDGQTSTALLYSSLLKLAGRDRVRYHVPNRFKEGHGIRIETLKALLSDSEFTPHCIVTCDTGISDGPAIGLAKDAGVRVIITDHHDPDPELLAAVHEGRQIWGANSDQVGSESIRRADAIVDPKFLSPTHHLYALPGVGVAYKFVEALFARSGCAGQEVEYLDLVALGIVADVAEQVNDTRYLLQLGLARLRQTHRAGLLALMEVAGVEPGAVDAESIGFQLGPRMNALGRLEDASDAVELLTTKDALRAGQLAAKMERLNHQRRLLTSQITAAALTMIEHRPQLLDYNAIVLGHETWHPGIVGIVAARMVEEFHKPTVLLVTPKDGPARGSARSVPSVDIGASIAACSPLLTQFGGHPGAAGVTLDNQNIDRFRSLLHKRVAEYTIADAPRGLTIDAELTFDQVTLEMIEGMRLLAPFGNGNSRPLFFSSAVSIVADKRIGRQENHRRLRVKDATGTEQTVVWWNAEETMLPREPLDLAYSLSINEFRGTRSPQLVYADSRRSPAIEQDLVDSAAAVRLHDLRRREIAAENLPQPPGAVWYVEGVAHSSNDSQPRYAPRHAMHHNTATTLVVWTVPPSPEVLQWMQETVQPSDIVLCGYTNVDDALPALLRQVAGMCKYAIDRDGELHIERMAARLATTEAVIGRCLRLLEVNGTIELGDCEETICMRVRPGKGVAPPANDSGRVQLQAELEEALAEVRAYRRFFRRASIDALGLTGVADHDP